jgi:hypothetical protein
MTAELKHRHNIFMPDAAAIGEARLKKERALARLRELQSAKLEGQLLDLDQVQRVWGAAFARLRDLALGLPERVASRGAHRSAAELQQIVSMEVEALLSAVAKGEIVTDG